MSKPKYQTFTGIKAEDIPAKLAERLPAEAYKGVPGGADLTDINTGFMIERMTAVFGPKGLGWSLDYGPDALQTISEGNRPMTRLAYAIFKYWLWDDKDERIECSFPVSGTNQNSAQYNEEGARTSATGAAIKWLCFQNDVYKGLWDHHDADKEKQQAARTQVPVASSKPATAAAAAQPTDNDEPAAANWQGVTMYQDLAKEAKRLGVKVDTIEPGKTTKGQVRSLYGALQTSVAQAQAAKAAPAA